MPPCTIALIRPLPIGKASTQLEAGCAYQSVVSDVGAVRRAGAALLIAGNARLAPVPSIAIASRRLTSIFGFSCDKLSFKHGIGCTYCHNTGYKGQIGVFELLELDSALCDALRQDDTTTFGRLVHEDSTFQPLAVSGLHFVSQGMTTLSEVIRITGETVNKMTTKQIETLLS